MTCELWKDKLGAYVDSASPENELAGLEEHLKNCPSCAADALSRLQLKRLTRAAAVRYAPSLEFRLRIENSIQKKTKPIWASWMPRLAVAAVALILAVVSIAAWMRQSAREQALTELIDLHVATLASSNPVDVVSTDRHTVKPWFQGKLPFTFNLPELQNSSFKLIGGRVTYFQHSPGAQLLFGLRNHQLSVFILKEHPGMVPTQAGIITVQQMAFNLETWEEGGLRYVIISDSSPADVHELGQLLRAAAHS
ncbi:MAG TPA: zf-HC2 domain-containing protein [Terriglobales bacterium]|nr:zf-HC2 domain-containing protein [Terriglobales bacterium]